MRTLFLAALLMVVTSFATPVYAQSSVYGNIANFFAGTGLGNILSCLPATGSTCSTQTQYIYSAAIGTTRRGTPLPETKDVFGRPTGPKLLATQTIVRCPSGTTVGYAQQGSAPFSPQLSASQLAQRSEAQAHVQAGQAGILQPSSGQPFWQSIFQPFQQFSDCLSSAGDAQGVEGEDETGSVPAVPTLTSTARCVIGTPHTITMTSTDPDNDNLRYGIDWDADGSVNEWVPPSGYAASGASQSASRTYSMPGDKTVKVMAEDESGLSSDWATRTFSCTETPLPAGQCSDTTDNDADGLVDSLDPDCSATAGLSEFPTGQPPAAPLAAPPSPILDLRVIPSLVRSGNTTRVSWSAQNVASCTVSAPNGDSWNALQSPLGGETSRPITAETTYTLSCVDSAGLTVTRTATVRIIPTFQEL